MGSNKDGSKGVNMMLMICGVVLFGMFCVAMTACVAAAFV